jgi:hypothetical protein
MAMGLSHAFETQYRKREMVCADMMPRSTNAPLERRECVLDSVCMNVSHHIDMFRVIDRLMFSARDASSLDRGGIGRVAEAYDVRAGAPIRNFRLKSISQGSNQDLNPSLGLPGAGE